MNRTSSLKKHHASGIHQFINRCEGLASIVSDKISTFQGSSNVRRIQAKDNFLVKEFIQKTLRERGGVGLDQLYYDRELSNLKEVYDSEGSAFFVLTKNCDVIGTIGIKKSGEGACEIKKLYLQEFDQNHFVSLINMALSTAKRMGYSSCSVQLENRDKLQIPLFERLRFTPAKNNTDQINMVYSL